jgi:hypothetical protein
MPSLRNLARPAASGCEPDQIDNTTATMAIRRMPHLTKPLEILPTGIDLFILSSFERVSNWVITNLFHEPECLLYYFLD